MATSFGTKIAIAGLVRQIMTRRLLMRGLGLSRQPTECRYYRYPTTKAGCHGNHFWATVCKTVRNMLSDRYQPVRLSCAVCDVRALWPNGWMDQDETRHAGRPRPWPHCVRCTGTQLHLPEGAQPNNFLPICIVVKWLDASRCHLVGR